MLALLYGVLRFITEFFRDMPLVGLNFTLAQIFSLAVVLLSLILLLIFFAIKGYRKGRV